jgi:hypothetical protein
MITDAMAHTEPVSGDTDRVRAHSPENLNQQIDVQAERCVEQLAGADRETINRHIDDLSREWDMERYLEANASLLSLGGVLLGATVNRKFLILPGVVFGFLLQHALQGWCPPMPVFRRMGVRTRTEINREKFALKALRGDFDAVGGAASRPTPVVEQSKS